MSPPISYAALLREIADEDWNDDPTDVVARLHDLASLLDRIKPEMIEDLREYVDRDTWGIDGDHTTKRAAVEQRAVSILASLAGAGDAPGAL